MLAFVLLDLSGSTRERLDSTAKLVYPCTHKTVALNMALALLEVSSCVLKFDLLCVYKMTRYSVLTSHPL